MDEMIGNHSNPDVKGSECKLLCDYCFIFSEILRKHYRRGNFWIGKWDSWNGNWQMKVDHSINIYMGQTKLWEMDEAEMGSKWMPKEMTSIADMSCRLDSYVSYKLVWEENLNFYVSSSS